MPKKINIVGAKPKKIEVIRPAGSDASTLQSLAASLGRRRSEWPASSLPSLDPIALAELGTQLLQRLRSSGGRPALADATINCRVPLSPEDMKTLETMVEPQMGDRLPQNRLSGNS